MYTLLIILSLFNTPEKNYLKDYSSDAFMKSSLPDKTLNLKDYDNALLNATVFHMINEKRRAKKLKALEYNVSLKKSCDHYQSLLEFRTFKRAVSVERKLKKDLLKKTKSFGFKGTLVLPVCGQNNAVKYKEKTIYHYDKNDKETDLHLFLGKKPGKKDKGKERKIIPHHTYRSYAKELLEKLNSPSKKKLYSKVYKWGACDLKWYYKTLNRKRIPQIKMVFILGGFQTDLMRSLEE